MIDKLKKIIPEINLEGLAKEEGIIKQMNKNSPEKYGNSNPKLFAWQFFSGSDYLVEAVKSFEG